MTALLLALLAAAGAAAAVASPTAPAAAIVSSSTAATATTAERDRITSTGLAWPATAPAASSTLRCPSDTMTLESGDNLSKVAVVPNKTYLLPTGDYTITSTIVLNTPGTTTCYQLVKSDDPPLSVIVDVADASYGKRAWVVQNGARLGLQDMWLYGNGTSSGILAEQATNPGGVVLRVTGGGLLSFINVRQAPPVGAAVVLNSVDATFSGCYIAGNRCEREGGALAMTNSNVVFRQVYMGYNNASSGGAIAMQDSRVTFEDRNYIYDNSALGSPPGVLSSEPSVYRHSGGAIRMRGGSVTISGEFCAQNNDASGGGFGGFAYVETGEVIFSQGSRVNFGMHWPDTMWIHTSKASVRCGSAGAAPWKADRTYTVKGSACACNATFVEGTTSWCDGCKRGEKCACFG